MATPIVNTNLAGATITYNAVQFGGADAPVITSPAVALQGYPPSYSFRGQYRYDESHRAIMGVDYTLQVRMIVFASSEANMAANMDKLRHLLSQPGQLLKIEGMGTGFGKIASPITDPTANHWDLDNGPKPGSLDAVPLGQLSWELSWSISFFINECVSLGEQLDYLAFNFNTTWRNDFEGMTTRVITGHVIIPQFRDYSQVQNVLHVADETRGTIVIAVPPNFQRVENTWRENDGKERLDFSITDEAIQGDHLPPGITAGDGSFMFEAGDGKGGFAQGVAALSCSFKTAINQPKNLAGQIFLAAVLTKQAEIQTALPVGNVIIPIKLRISNGKFTRARQTDCSIVWMITGCLNAMLNATNIWQAVGDNNQTTWKASMSALWNNRGFSGIGSTVSEAVIIDLCDNVYTKNIGVVGSGPNAPADAALGSMTCPDIADDGGWVNFDLDIRVHRQDNQSRHRKAASYVPTLGEIVVVDPQGGDTIKQGGHDYSQSASDEEITEYHGYPETLIALRFRGLRYRHKPYVPEIKTIGGKTVRLVKQEIPAPRWAFDAFGCPVWFVSGYRIYAVSGRVSETIATGSKTSCGAPTVLTDI